MQQTISMVSCLNYKILSMTDVLVLPKFNIGESLADWTSMYTDSRKAGYMISFHNTLGLLPQYALCSDSCTSHGFQEN